LIRKLRITALRLSLLPVVAVAVFVRPSWGLESTTAFLLELAGYLFLLAGLAIRIWCIFYIGGRKSRQIVTQGPYSICRNPLYMGTFLLAIGAGLCFENLIMLAMCVPIVLITHFVVVRMEEAHLEASFGEEYTRYKRRVPKYWPRLRNYESPETVPVSVRAIRRIAIDTAGVLLLPEIEDMLEILHDHGVVPVLWHFP
jgi:protein-S-isoprenylcysteine O-methyltransferase Ste14